MDARLSLRFDQADEGTAMRMLRQEPPWKIVRGFTTPTGECLVHLNNVSGGVLGGDHLHLNIEAGPGSQVQITTTGATRIYAPRAEARDSLCSADIHLHAGALLEYLPDPLIPFRGARAEQRTHITMDEGATLFWWEILAPGRLASGECFEYESLRVAAEVWAGDTPILIDRMRLEPQCRSVASPVRFGSHRFLITFVIAKIGAPHTIWRDLEATLEVDGVGWGVSALPAHGVLVRGLSDSGLSIAPVLHALWKTAKLLLCGRPVAAPRKTY
jgi:urease accessory protein